MAWPAAAEYPAIDPTSFDLICIGTSLPSSILAAAASSSGRTVLHLDPNPFYGSHYSSLSHPQLTTLLLPPPPPPPPNSLSSSNFCLIPLSARPLYSSVDLPPLPPHLTSLSLDVSGPRVLFCADNAVNLLIKSGISHYLDFKSVDATLFYHDGNLIPVPDSKSAIFKDKGLALTDKTRLMRFFDLVQTHLSTGGEEDHPRRIPQQDLDRPFIDFLTELRLPRKIVQIILYSIALADYDQENTECCRDLLTTEDGINRLALHHSSIGRFPNAQGAMLYPMYGQGELPQAFCRRAAVKGCIYVLGMPVTALLAEKDTGLYRGVRLASGQDIFSQKLIMDPHLVVPQAFATSMPGASEIFSQHPCPREIENKVARAICISRTSLKSDASNLLIVYPPRSLHPDQATSVRALQLSSNTAVCQQGMFVVHLSTLCDDAVKGRMLLDAAITTLFSQSTSGSASIDSAINSEETSVSPCPVPEQPKPVLEWSTLYIQEITQGSVHTISTSPAPDGSLSYHDLIGATEKVFQEIYPGEEFFPENVASEDTDSEVVDPE